MKHNSFYEKLRSEAEKLLSKEKNILEPESELEKLLRDIEVYHYELEIQNDQLCQTHLELSKSENQFKALLNNMPAGYFKIDSNSEIIELNNRAIEQLSLSKEEIIGKDFSQFVALTSLAEYQKFLAYAKKGEAPQPAIVLIAPQNKMQFTGQIELINFDQENNLGFIHFSLSDVSKWKNFENELIEQQEKFHFLDNLPDPVLALQNEKVVYINQSTSLFFEVTTQKMIGQSILSLLPKNSVSEIADYLDKIKRGEVLKNNFELSLDFGNRLFYTFIVNWSITEYFGEPAILIVLRDISEKKAMEEAVINTEAKIQRLIEQLPVGVYRTTLDGQILFANPALIKMLHYDSLEEFLELNTSDTYLNPEVKDVLAEIEASKKGYYQDIKQLLTKHKSIIWVRDTRRAIFTVQNKFAYFDGILEDITTEIEQQKELEKFKTISDNANYGAAITDSEGNIVYLNKFFANLHNYKRIELLGTNIFNLLAKNQDFDKQKIQELLNKEDGYPTLEIWHNKQGGELIPLLMSAKAIKDEFDEATFISISAVSLVTQKQVEKELRFATEIAESANRAKSEFLSNMSHELRTPLNPIIGFASILLNEYDFDDEVKELLEMILNASKNLSNVLNNLLDMSTLQFKQYKLENVPFSLKSFVNETMIQHFIRAKAKNVQISINISDELADSYLGDKERLKSIFNQLIDNCFKFANSNNPTIEIEIKLCECLQKKDFDFADEENIRFIAFNFKDNGIGIEQSKLEQIFELFSQADTSTTREFGGIGIGLSIVKHIVNLMQGEITVKSELNKGSNFKLCLPLREITHTSEEYQPIQDIIETETKKIINVLVAEDDLSNIILFEKFLTNENGYNTHFASNGAKAVELFKLNTYDLILMDIKMPILNGIDATIEIRKFEKELKRERRVPIIGITAMSAFNDKSNYLEVGMNEVLFKPYSLDRLSEIIYTYTR